MLRLRAVANAKPVRIRVIILFIAISPFLVV